MCTICKIRNKDLQDEIEMYLMKNHGILSIQDKKELVDKYPDYRDDIEKITSEDCEVHFNFHQTVTAVQLDTDAEKQSLTKDINKSEAEILYDLMNKQAATFNALTNKINNSLIDTENDITHIVVHPDTLDFYNNLAMSIRATVKELRELNVSINGAKDSAMEGLKALAKALNPGQTDAEEELTTKEFD